MTDVESVRFTPKSGHDQCRHPCPLSARSRREGSCPTSSLVGNFQPS
jgi:hypothetical protein